MKESVATILVFLIVFVAKAEPFYITDDRLTNFSPFIPTKAQIDKAKSAKESRPAADDPEGNWGPVTEGCQLSIRLEKRVFTNGEPVVATMLLRNVAEKPIRYRLWNPGEIDFKMEATLNGRKIYRNDEPTPDMTFKEKLKFIRTGIGGIATVAPSTQRESVENLAHVFNLTTNGEYSVKVIQDIGTLAAAALTNAAKIDEARSKRIPLSTNVVSGITTFYVTNAPIK